MKRTVIHLIAAARPNFMKIAPAYHALAADNGFDPILIHTGQHYDVNMSDAFFKDLRLPPPDFHLGVGSGSHAEQTAGVMVAYEKICLSHRPDWVVVAGDVNSTIACALAAKKLHLNVAHLEAGLRSGDRSMPEEINRILTDSISDLLWTPSSDGDENLLQEGIPASRIDRIGNIMIDSYEMMRPQIETTKTRDRFGLSAGEFAALTLHRPANVDHRETLAPLIEDLIVLSDRLPLVFAIHPRTRGRLEEFDLIDRLHASANIHLTAPLSYIEFMSLVTDAKMVITDSGGIQEETTYLGIPCLTLRDTTERPVTLTQGSNKLVPLDQITAFANRALAGEWPTGHKPDLWDGHTANRLVASLRRHC